MPVIKRGTKRHFDVRRVTALVVLTLIVFLVGPNGFGQTKPVEEHLAEIKKRIDDISRAPDKPDGVELHEKKEWHCASAALRRTGDAIEWVGVEEGVKKTFAAALKVVADIASLGGATRVGTVGEILSAYAESENLQQFTKKLGEMAALKAFGKVLPEQLDETQRELIKTLAEKIWKALGGEKGPTSIEKIWEDPVCGNIKITLRITTEGVTEKPLKKPREENLVQKNCEKLCAQARDKWLDERNAVTALEREAKAQEDKLNLAKRDLEDAQRQLRDDQKPLTEARKSLDAATKNVQFWEDLAKKNNTDPATIGKDEYQNSLVRQRQATENIGKWQSRLITWQEEVNRLTKEIVKEDGLKKSSSEARASANKQLEAEKDAQHAYRMCLKNCYDALRKLGISPRDKENLEKLQDPLKAPVEELLAGYVPPTPPEPRTKSSRKKFLRFEATGDCHCKFPKNYPDDERLGSFGVVGEAELIPQNPVVEGETIAINYKLDTVKFEVVASCGCKTAAKSETAIPKETRTQTQSAKPISQPEQKTAHFYLPSGMERLSEVTAASFYSSPVAPAGAWCPCCACCWPYGQPNYSSIGGVLNVNIRLCMAMDKVGIGQAIHIAYDRQHYDAETYLQWNASGGPELKVDLEVLRPGSAAFEKLLAASEASNGFLFATKNPGTYLFRATAKDSSGRSSFNTLSLTFPVIESDADDIPK